MLFFSLRLAGQVDTSGIGIFSGKIVDDSLECALPSVHVWNESLRMGTFSDDSGEFKIALRNQDTIVFSALGYRSSVLVVSPSLNQIVRLKVRTYELDEVVVRRFRSYESFIYEVVHYEPPESKIAELKEYVQLMSTAAALEADRKRAVEDKLETGRFGFITPLGRGIDPQKALKVKMNAQKRREEVIHSKFNRLLVGDITQLDGDELSKFIAFCNFSEDYLYDNDLYTIIEDLYAKLEDYQINIDTTISLEQP